MEWVELKFNWAYFWERWKEFGRRTDVRLPRHACSTDNDLLDDIHVALGRVIWKLVHCIHCILNGSLGRRWKRHRPDERSNIAGCEPCGTCNCVVIIIVATRIKQGLSNIQAIKYGSHNSWDCNWRGLRRDITIPLIRPVIKFLPTVWIYFTIKLNLSDSSLHFSPVLVTCIKN